MVVDTKGRGCSIIRDRFQRFFKIKSKVFYLFILYIFYFISFYFIYLFIYFLLCKF